MAQKLHPLSFLLFICSVGGEGGGGFEVIVNFNYLRH